MKKSFEELPDGLRNSLLKGKEILYVYLGRNPDDALKRLLEYGPRTSKHWRRTRYAQMLAVDKARKQLGLEPIFFLDDKSTPTLL